MPDNILTSPRLAHTLRRDDYGFFGPDSVVWKVWSYPTMLPGLQRSVALQFLNPFFAAAHENAKGVYQRPAHFYDVTLSFLFAGVFGDSRIALETSEFIKAIHTKVTGVEPISKRRYHANSPEAQLYTHVDGWQSMLKCYEVFGPGVLDPDEERRYWAECAVAAELFTCKPEDVPRSREAVREYYAAIRPQLCISEHARSGMRQQLYTSGPYADTKVSLISRLSAPGVLATTPRWIRELCGLNQPAVVDALSVPVYRGIFRGLGASRRAVSLAVGIAAPVAGAILRAHFTAPTPRNPQVLTPGAAREALGDKSSRDLLSEMSR